MVLLTLMYSILVFVSLWVAVLMINEYLKSSYNHIENLWFGLAFLIFAFVYVNNIVDMYTSFPLAYNPTILVLYAYWIMLIMAFRLRQLKSKWSYRSNKITKLVLLIIIVSTMYFFHELEGFYCNEVYRVLYTHVLAFISLLTFIVIPSKGYYIFFKIGYLFLFISNVLCLVRGESIYYTPHIFKFSGIISIAIAVYFIFYSDSILLKRENREGPRRQEDKVM